MCWLSEPWDFPVSSAMPNTASSKATSQASSAVMCLQYFPAGCSSVSMPAEGWNPLAYSLAYNGAYIFAEGVITVIVLMIPAVSKALTQVKMQANE